MTKDGSGPQRTLDPKGVAVPATLGVAAKLVVVGGPDEGLEVPLGAPVEVGTEPGCQLLLHDLAVSRRHLLVTMTAGRIVVKDRGSRNGTFLGSTRVME